MKLIIPCPFIPNFKVSGSNSDLRNTLYRYMQDQDIPNSTYNMPNRIDQYVEISRSHGIWLVNMFGLEEIK